MKSVVQNRISTLRNAVFLKRQSFEDDLYNLTTNLNATNATLALNDTLNGLAKDFFIYLAEEEGKIVDNIFDFQKERHIINDTYTKSCFKVKRFQQKYISLYETSKMVNFSYYPMMVVDDPL